MNFWFNENISEKTRFKGTAKLGELYAMGSENAKISVLMPDPLPFATDELANCHFFTLK
jgi:hypothetical protein